MKRNAEFLGNLLLCSESGNGFTVRDLKTNNILYHDTVSFSTKRTVLKNIPKTENGSRYYRGYEGILVGAACRDRKAFFFIPAQDKIQPCFDFAKVYRNEHTENLLKAWRRLDGPALGDIFPRFDAYENSSIYNSQVHYFLFCSKHFTRASRATTEKIFSLGGFDYVTQSDIPAIPSKLSGMEELTRKEAARFLIDGFHKGSDAGEFIFVRDLDGSMSRVESAAYLWRKRNYQTGDIRNYYRKVKLRYRNPLTIEEIYFACGSIVPPKILLPKVSTLTSKERSLRIVSDHPVVKSSNIDDEECHRLLNYIICTPLHLQRKAFKAIVNREVFSVITAC